MNTDELIRQAKLNDGNLSFAQADSLWSSIDRDEKILLAERLEHLCDLQDQTCNDLDKKSLRYHARITGLLEEKGKLLGDLRYYYRAWTYVSGADYLYRMDMAELAIDCYFRALIFQGNFEMSDEGKLLFRTIQAILACYMKMEDVGTMRIIIEDFDQKMAAVSRQYKAAYVGIRQCMQGPFHMETESLKKLETEVAEYESEEADRLIEDSFFGCHEGICG